ncbi:MAG: class I SAM-dependent methyltransferase [Verrucomicrobia bacterium]|nr:class I SAM-dependent methyltransferase [Verrucomicrobiota bacterium]
MHGLPNHDKGRQIDWGKTSADYAVYRPGYPASFFQRLARLAVGLPGQRILDLGTGTGVLARVFAAQGCRVMGTDIAENQIAEARRLAAEQGVTAEFMVAPAEDTGLPDTSRDVISASQSWLYFDKNLVIPEVLRVLAPGGCLMTCHFCWLPRQDEVARRTEELVLKFNPNWSAGNWSGDIPPQPEWSRERFRVRTMFYYDEPIPFARETWRGRIRACRGVGATLSAGVVEQFDSEHARMLEQTVSETFTVLHRIDCHIFEPVETRSHLINV